MNDSAILSALSFWKEFDLESKRVEYDGHAAKIAENQEQSVPARTALVEETKKFGKQLTEEQGRVVKPIIKRYQQEIDRLTTRAKEAENCYLDMYKSIATLTDPSAALSAAAQLIAKAQRANQLEIENNKLSNELASFRKEFQEIQNQEVTIRRLEDNLAQYEQQLESMIGERVRDNERVLNEQWSRQLEEAAERERELSAALSGARDQLSAAKEHQQITEQQLYQTRAQINQQLTAKQSEIDLLVVELERTSTRVTALERENTEVTRELKIARDSPGSHERGTTQWEVELAEKDSQLESLSAQLKSVEHEHAALQHEHEQLQREQRSARDELQERINVLNDTLRTRPSEEEWREVKKKAELFDALGYNESSAESVESALREKNKRLETQVMELKSRASDVERRLGEAMKRSEQQEMTLNEQRRLIGKLEEDLAASQQGPSSAAPRLLGTPGQLPNDASESASAVPQDQAMLNIVLHQRDRFKQRIIELEEENRAVHEQLKTVQLEVQAVKKDNVKLYERIRFIQSYNAPHSSAANNTLVNRERGDIERGEDNVEDKYKKMYEESVNPFTAFNRKVSNSPYFTMWITVHY
eukprot:TRINITY_DN2130_c0_g1_i2.p1 TRINITY_DN2130_c0_g1~~TRINITY_DN2130_c0_g1_i2.p1  ORF type:complete len:590 (+),score=267.77 TRINITY_DN2130_c0_g1_i2:48-1817(+)